MGKPGSSPLLRPGPDAVSLPSRNASAAGSSAGPAAAVTGTSRRSLFDTDDDAPELFLDTDDLPPLYSEVMEADLAAENAAMGPGAEATPLMPGAGSGAGAGAYNDTAYADGSTAPLPWRYCVTPFSGTQGAPSFVEQLQGWCSRPPRPYVQLRGTHCEADTRDDKKGTREVVDFDVKVELTPYLYSNAAEAASWRVCRTADNAEKTHRGTVFRHRAPGFDDGGRAGRHDVEQGAHLDAPRPTAEEWCTQFCTDPAPLRSFTLRRRMTGFDEAKVRKQLELLVRRTNYHGDLHVGFPVYEEGVVCYSDHRINQWRIKKWIQALCALTLLWVLTWPYLFLRTQKYDVVSVEWPFSRTTARGDKEYVSLSEDQWYNMWARAIANAVLCKRQGTLDQEDLRQAEVADPTFGEAGGASRNGRLGIMHAGISAMNQINRQLGWGGNI